MAAPTHPVAVTMAASPASQYRRREASRALAGGFLSGQVFVCRPTYSNPGGRGPTCSSGMKRHPAAEQPQGGDPQEKAGQAWGQEDPLCPRAQVLQDPAAWLPGGRKCCEHRAAAHLLPSDLVLILLLPSGLLLNDPPFHLPRGWRATGREHGRAWPSPCK